MNLYHWLQVSCWPRFDISPPRLPKKAAQCLLHGDAIKPLLARIGISDEIDHLPSAEPALLYRDDKLVPFLGRDARVGVIENNVGSVQGIGSFWTTIEHGDFIFRAEYGKFKAI